ncbi:MAG: hypothetical protein EHM71_18625 [Zetaproteobacteria bacterium]|nr:MAG: hypothetical protein EHM71_18625 [Zetaproteobacteria bacterium]
MAVGDDLPGAGGRRLVATPLLTGLEYRYVGAKGPVDAEPRVVHLRTGRAVLVVETAPTPPPAVAAHAGLPPVPEYVLSTQQRLDAALLGRVRVRAAGGDAYDVSATDLRTALAHGGRVLMEAWAAVRPMLSWEHGVQLRVHSALADGVLGADGFRVTSPKLAARAGLEAGDVVRAVNGQPVTGFADVFRLYRQVRANPHLSVVDVTLERQGLPVTKTYRIR